MRWGSLKTVRWLEVMVVVEWILIFAIIITLPLTLNIGNSLQ